MTMLVLGCTENSLSMTRSLDASATSLLELTDLLFQLTFHAVQLLMNHLRNLLGITEAPSFSWDIE
jgi:hypothetical protein